MRKTHFLKKKIRPLSTFLKKRWIVYKLERPSTEFSRDKATMQQAPPASVQMACAITAANTAAAIVAANASLPAQHVEVDQRDPQLIAFEKYLVDNLRQTDVVRGEDGVLLFNVNQVAYLAEESATEDQQRTTRKRISGAIENLEHIIKRVPPGYKGMYSLQYLAGKWSGSRVPASFGGIRPSFWREFCKNVSFMFQSNFLEYVFSDLTICFLHEFRCPLCQAGQHPAACEEASEGQDP